MLIIEVQQNQEHPLSYIHEEQHVEINNAIKSRHPLISRPKAMVGIVIHSLRHPGKPAIIDLDTGDVRVCSGK